MSALSERLCQIGHFQLHPELLPYVGPQYETFRILLIGESHYLPDCYAQREGMLEGWYRQPTGLFCGIGLWDGEHLTAPSPAERRFARRTFGLWHPRRKGLYCFYEYCDGPSLDLCHRPTVIENGVNAHQFTEICGTLDRIISAIREEETTP